MRTVLGLLSQAQKKKKDEKRDWQSPAEAEAASWEEEKRMVTGKCPKCNSENIIYGYRQIIMNGQILYWKCLDCEYCFDHYGNGVKNE